MGKLKEYTLVGLFGNAPLTRVLDYIVSNRDTDFSKRDVTEGAEISWNTLEKIWDRLETNGFIIKTRKSGKSQLYTLNAENWFARQLIAIDRMLFKIASEEFKKFAERYNRGGIVKVVKHHQFARGTNI